MLIVGSSTGRLRQGTAGRRETYNGQSAIVWSTLLCPPLLVLWLACLGWEEASSRYGTHCCCPKPFFVLAAEGWHLSVICAHIYANFNKDSDMIHVLLVMAVARLFAVQCLQSLGWCHSSCLPICPPNMSPVVLTCSTSCLQCFYSCCPLAAP